MNKRGQVLVLFILLIPVFLTLFALVIDIGLLYNEDKHIESSIKEAIYYGLENVQDIDIKNRIETLISKNVKDTSSIIVNIDNEYIYVTVEKIYNGSFKSLFKNNIYVIHNSYYGYMNDNKLVISKE